MKRRDLLRNSAIAGGSAWMLGQSLPAACADEPETDSAPVAGPAGVRQSVMGWCFSGIKPLELAKHCKRIGLEAMEGIPASSYDEVTKLGLKISLVGSHGFTDGPLNPTHHAECERKLREGIDLAVRYGAPNVITFTGMKTAGISDEAARRNCIACWKRVLPYAEQHHVGIVLEHLNSRDDSHPMKGHPGYWGDDVHLCADLVREMDSPQFRLLFDIYHVQIMNGDLIRNLQRYHRIIGHYHTAGNPGRGEIDQTQEINYPAVIRAIMETGYQGYVAQEFIPTSDDPIASLEHAFGVCNI